MQQELGLLLARGLKDPRVGFVTLTEVRLPNDLRQATVYVSILGDAEAQKASLKRLQAAAGYLRRQLGTALKMRYCPELRFVPDATLDQARRLDELLAAAGQGSTELPPPPPSEGSLPAPHTGREMPLPEAFALPAPPANARRRARSSGSLRRRRPRGGSKL